MFQCWCHTFCHMAQNKFPKLGTFKYPSHWMYFNVHAAFCFFLYSIYANQPKDMIKAKGYFTYCLSLPLQISFACVSFRVSTASLKGNIKKEQVHYGYYSFHFGEKLTEKQKTTNVQTIQFPLGKYNQVHLPAIFKVIDIFLTIDFFFSTCWKWKSIPSAVHCINKTLGPKDALYLHFHKKQFIISNCLATLLVM